MKLQAHVIAALVAAAGFAQAEVTENFLLDYTSAHATGRNSPPVSSEDSPLTITSVTGRYNAGNDNNFSLLGGNSGSGEYTKSLYAPWMNIVANKAGWTWTLTFTVSEDVQLTAIQVALFSTNGTTVTAAPSSATNCKSEVKFTLTQGGTQVAGFPQTGTQNYYNATNVSYSLPTGADTTNATAAAYSFESGEIISGSGAIVTVGAPVLLEANKTYTLAITPWNGSGSAMAVGLAGVNFVIPEPATASLSLLALAGIAARRRRK